eukprot:jgi/Chrzof1/2904/Cz12g03130.t1
MFRAHAWHGSGGCLQTAGPRHGSCFMAPRASFTRLTKSVEAQPTAYRGGFYHKHQVLHGREGTYKGPIRMTVACYTTPGDTGASPATAMAIDATADTVEDFTASIAGTATGASATANVPSAQPHLHHNSTRSSATTLHAVVVGAGPAGVTAAMYLAQRGWAVDVYERRPPPSESTSDQKRTYIMGIGERAMQALEHIGVQLPNPVNGRMRGSVYVYKDPNKKRIVDAFSEDARILGIDRHSFTVHLVAEAQRLFPNTIQFHFNNKLGAVNVANKTAAFRNRDASTGAESATASYDLLIGGDGASSGVRAAMMDQVPGMKVQDLSSPVANLEYKAFHNLPHNDEFKALIPDSSVPGMWFFAFNNPQPDNPSPGSITLYQTPSGTWSGTMMLPPERYAAMSSVADHEAAIRWLTPPSFPQTWIPSMAAQMAELGTPSRINPMHWSNQIIGPGILLVGDAAHNVTPQMGQGCNSALEDIRVLDEMLAQEGQGVNDAEGVQRVLQKFQQKRLPQVHALQDMEYENAWVRRPLLLFKEPMRMTLARLCWMSFILLLPLLRVLLPRGIVHKSLFQTIMANTTPYNTLHTFIRVSPFIWAGIMATLTAAVRSALRLVWA